VFGGYAFRGMRLKDMRLKDMRLKDMRLKDMRFKWHAFKRYTSERECFEADIFLHRTDEQTDSPSPRAFKCVHSNVCSRLCKRLRYEARHIGCTKEEL
jgi:hypothetical protein